MGRQEGDYNPDRGYELVGFDISRAGFSAALARDHNVKALPETGDTMPRGLTPLLCCPFDRSGPHE